MKQGQVGILNVGAGDTKLTFDPNNPAETIRARRVVKDMLRRGYALLVRLEDGKYTRALDFDEKTGEYIIADFDPVIAADVDAQDHADHGPQSGAPNAEVKAPKKDKAAAALDDGVKLPPPAVSAKRGRPSKRVAAESVGAVAVARTAGG